MVKAAVGARPRPQEDAAAIFSRDGFKWRGATLRVELTSEPLLARLEEVQGAGMANAPARLMVLDELGQPEKVRQVGWPPEGEVAVVRAS